MYRLVLVMMITAVAWSSVGCGGPGKPVNKAADLRNRSGGGTAEEAQKSGRGNRGGANQDQNKEDEKASDGDEESGDSQDGDGTTEAGDGDEEAKESEKEADSSAGSVAESKNRLRPGRPPGLAFASGAGGGRGGDKDEDDLKAKEDKEKERPPAEVKDDAPAAGIENESPVEEHRFTFFERANYAFSTENETEAFQYLYAHAIAEDNALNEHPIAWYAGISEPRLGLRWGVGVDYSAGSFDGDPDRFGDESASSSGGGGTNNTGDIGGRDLGNRLPNGRRRPSAGSGSTAGEPPSGDDPTEQLLYYTGDFGDLLLQRIELRRTNPDFYWGKALHDIDATKTFEVRTPASGARSAPDRGNRDRGNRAGGGSNLSNEDSGEQPPVNTDTNSGNDNDRRNPSPDIPGFEPEFQADPTSLVPGAIMLGLGNRKEILERAQLHGVDLVAIFDVKISGSTNKNTTMLTIFNVKTGIQVAESRRLNTVAYANALDSGKENPIELELDKLFPEATDKEYKCSEFPDISADRASTRVEELLAIKTDNPLPILVEVKHYLEKGLITKDEYIAAAEALIGAGNARKLVDGNIDEREEALHDWLPGQYSVNVANSDGFR